ncbi:MAG: ABC transporter ATP-binding protein [Nitrososphaeria archaeon]
MNSKEIMVASKVSKRFGGIKALDNVDFILKRREIVGLIGPNGSGKTTLINIMSGFYKPDGGRVFLDGEDVTNLPPYSRALKGIARTFQLTKSFSNVSVFDNVMVGALLKSKDLSEAKNRTTALLKKIGLENFSQRLCKELPIGIKKKVEMARALAIEPKILLLDEVLAGLSVNEMDEILDFIASLKKVWNISIVMVEHIVKAVVKVADRIVVLSSGQVIAEGLPEEIIRNPKIQEIYLGGKIL